MTHVMLCVLCIPIQPPLIIKLIQQKRIKIVKVFLWLHQLSRHNTFYTLKGLFCLDAFLERVKYCSSPLVDFYCKACVYVYVGMYHICIMFFL
jgi:hypothetical protein